MTACAHDQTRRPLPKKVSACVAPGRSGQVISGQVSQSFQAEPIFGSFQPATRASKATMIQSPGGVGKEKDGARMPRPARRGDHIWGKLAHGALDETRRTGLLPVGPLWLRASCFVSPSHEWGRPDNRATCTATCCKSPTTRSRSKITIKQTNKLRHSAAQTQAQAQGTGSLNGRLRVVG